MKKLDSTAPHSFADGTDLVRQPANVRAATHIYIYLHMNVYVAFIYIYVTANVRNQILPGFPNPFRESGESLK